MRVCCGPVGGVVGNKAFAGTPLAAAEVIVLALVFLVRPLPGQDLGGCPARVYPQASIVSSNAGPNVFDGVNINSLVGADRFYAAGYWGGNAIIANVEAGHIWDGHDTLIGRVGQFVQLSDLSGQRQYDWHATMVGHVLGGAGWGYGLIIGEFNLATWYGLAPAAELWSGSISTGWVPDPPYDYTGRFNISEQSVMHVLDAVASSGIGGRRADVLNCSWGLDDPAGQAWETLVIDGLARAARITVVLAAGNHETGTAQVGGPASGYNSIAAAALAGDMTVPVYGAVATFSNTGPNDYYNPKDKTTLPAARAAVDLAAPGDNLTLAFYGGLTGGHISGSDPTAGNNTYYIRDMGGTSFAAPIIAGGAALLVDLARDRFGTPESVDGRVIKAVLLNSADKPAGWTNAPFLADGVLTTTRGLDYASGAGAMNLDRAFDQFTAGTADLPGEGGGTIKRIGWDFGLAAENAPVEYLFDESLHAGQVMTATLTWFVNRTTDVAGLTAADVQFSDMDLQVWRQDGADWNLVAQSASGYNNVEHLWFALPADGNYQLRVVWFGENYDLAGLANEEYYAVAWSVVPEPGTIALLAVGATALIARRRIRRTSFR